MHENKFNRVIEFEKSMKIWNEIYELGYKLGEGNFGTVFLGFLELNSTSASKLEQRYWEGNKYELPKLAAIKIEKEQAECPIQLHKEIEVYKQIHEHSICKGFPIFYESGTEKGHQFIITELLGLNLADLLKLCGGKFSVLTTTALALQMFQRVQTLHNHGYLYRDIKPENFVMGTGSRSSILYLIDFGLAKKYRDEQSNLLRPYKEKSEIHGNLRYASIGSHLRIEQSMRDDLESLCYLLIYFMRGKLPWQKSRSKSNYKNQEMEIMEAKMKMGPKELCQGLPQQLETILEYCLSLEFSSTPDYDFIMNELIDLFEQHSSQTLFSYDWMQISEKKQLNKQFRSTLSPLS